MDIESGLGQLHKRNIAKVIDICARYIVANEIGKENVPADLYPNMHERAEKKY